MAGFPWRRPRGRRWPALAAAASLAAPAGAQHFLEYDCYRQFDSCGLHWSAAQKRFCFHELGVLCMDDSAAAGQDPVAVSWGREETPYFPDNPGGESENYVINTPPPQIVYTTTWQPYVVAPPSPFLASTPAPTFPLVTPAPTFPSVTLPPPPVVPTTARTTAAVPPAAPTTSTTGAPTTSAAGPSTVPRSPTLRGGSTTVLTTPSPFLIPKMPEPPKGEKQQLSREPWTADPAAMEQCSSYFHAPQPDNATDLNGIFLPPVCFTQEEGLHHVFVIGDWGGISESANMVPVPADHRSPKFPNHRRPFVIGADNCAQLNVAEQMMLRAEQSKPDYVINCGDNFYWGGVQEKCGKPVHRVDDHHGQWERVFERIYRGDFFGHLQWLGVLGNHDFGGWTFAHGWDQTISYTWATGAATTGRWFTPALYWGQQVRYRGFSVDYFFVDTNIFDAFDPNAAHNHNICSNKNNPEHASCGLMGPLNTDDCPLWFQRLWEAQTAWLEKGLSMSIATWQIVVTHFPPELGENVWRKLSYQYGIDLIITAHRHQQEIHHEPFENFLAPTAYIVSGGGGGITSESMPSSSGNDDQYGFMDLTLSKEEIVVESVSHGGALRKRACVARRLPKSNTALALSSNKSLCEGREKWPSPAPPRKHLHHGKYMAPDTSFFFEAQKKR